MNNIDNNNNKLQDLANNIKNIKATDVHLQIYDILKKNKVKVSQNTNGIFFDLTKCSEKTIKEINNIVNNTKKDTSPKNKITYTTYSTEDAIDNINNLGPRLSNQERNLIKKLKE